MKTIEFNENAVINSNDNDNSLLPFSKWQACVLRDELGDGIICVRGFGWIVGFRIGDGSFFRIYRIGDLEADFNRLNRTFENWLACESNSHKRLTNLEFAQKKYKELYF